MKKNTIQDVLLTNFTKEQTRDTITEIKKVKGFSIEKTNKDLLDLLTKLKNENKIPQNIYDKIIAEVDFN